MFNVETGDLAATTEIVSVYFSLRTRTSIDIPGELRARLEAQVIEDTGAA
jgi:acyl-CoA thioesterase FadM